MALDDTARESNLRDSVKKFFVDNLSRGEGLSLTFDKALSPPKTQGVEAKKWVSINFGNIDPKGPFSSTNLRIFCCTREDPEGYHLTHLRDKVMGYLTDSLMPDGMRRIVLYKTYDGAPLNPWIEIGRLAVFLDVESEQMNAADATKFKLIPVQLKWGAKLSG